MPTHLVSGFSGAPAPAGLLVGDGPAGRTAASTAASRPASLPASLPARG